MDARAECYKVGGHLPAFANKLEWLDFIRQLSDHFTPVQADEIWIAGSDFGEEDVFRWAVNENGSESQIGLQPAEGK